jgi:hypothetical protein
MMPVDELRKRDPDFDRVAALASINPKAAEQFFSLLIPLKGSDGGAVPHMRISTTYSCKKCRPTLEKAMAKLPSWAVVEINAGPGPDKIFST